MYLNKYISALSFCIKQKKMYKRCQVSEWIKLMAKKLSLKASQALSTTYNLLY